MVNWFSLKKISENSAYSDILHTVDVMHHIEIQISKSATNAIP